MMTNSKLLLFWYTTEFVTETELDEAIMKDLWLCQRLSRDDESHPLRAFLG
jgi:hypothetical protein